MQNRSIGDLLYSRMVKNYKVYNYCNNAWFNTRKSLFCGKSVHTNLHTRIREYLLQSLKDSLSWRI